MEIRSVQPSQIELVRQFLAANGWAQRVDDPQRFKLLLANSQRTAVAIEAGQIVGFARALCDSVANGYISMVVVAPDFRRRGIGRALVQHLVGSDPHITWVLRAGRESAGFWATLGFANSALAMERLRA